MIDDKLNGLAFEIPDLRLSKFIYEFVILPMITTRFRLKML